MASGPLPKRVTCPVCKAPQGYPCRDPSTFKNVKPHAERQAAAQTWYTTKTEDGLTPQRRDEMVAALQDVLRHRADVGAAMARITTAADPEAEFKRQVA